MQHLYLFIGGPGSEHNVSLASGRNIANTLKDTPNLDIHIVLLTQQGQYFLDEKTINLDDLLKTMEGNVGIILSVMHGAFGEDGQFARILEKTKLSFIGSGSQSLELTIDKQETGDFLRQYGIRVPQSFIVRDIHELHQIALDLPCIVKPRADGSSVSLYKPNSQEELWKICIKELKTRSDILVQEYIQGREFTCGVVEINDDILTLPPSEIILTKSDIFDYGAKYSPNGCREITPANIDDDLKKQIQELALQVHKLCGCKDISRTDMILNERGELVVLEINTIPGMTETSFIPQQLHAAELSIEDFVGSMVKKYKRS